MESNSLDQKVVRKCYNILTSKYVRESGRKFIFHLISAFLPLEEKAKPISEEDAKEKKMECCLSTCCLVPSTAPIDLNPRKVIVDHKLKLYPRLQHYGYKSDTSTKFISEEGIEALIQFIEYRVSIGDIAIIKMNNHIKVAKDVDEKVAKRLMKSKASRQMSTPKDAESMDILPSKPVDVNVLDQDNPV